MNNLPVMNIFTIVEFTFFILVFRQEFRSASMRRALLWGLPLFGLFGLFNLAYLQGAGRFNSWTMGLENFLLMLAVLLFLYDIFRHARAARLELYPMFWVASGALLYFAGSFFLFIFINFVLKESHDLAYADWGIHSVMNILSNFCYAAALWLSPGG